MTSASEPTFVSTLEPRAVFGHFDALLAIPRPSKAEERARAYVIGLAQRRGLVHRSDARGNLVVAVPASPGREGAPIVVLQSHLDMVTVKEPGVDHDFATDPIRPRRSGEWIQAEGTTLGADNGIGVATMLAWQDEPAPGPHGPLELLFTVDEETGLQGVADLDGSLVTGRLLINLDSEEEGEITIGCAGARGSLVSLPVVREAAPAGAVARRLSLSGLVGGHSGMDIAKGRGNAIGLLARATVAAVGDEAVGLGSLTGGQSHNAIPRDASWVVVISADALESFEARWAAETAAIAEEQSAVDGALAFRLEAAEPSGALLDPSSSGRLLELLLGLPHGVVAMSQDLPGLVETSTNLATLRDAGGGHVDVFLASRSSVDSALTALARRIRAIATLAGASVEESRGYPGWKPEPSSQLLALTREVLAAQLGREIEVGAVHAGLECGVIGSKCPGMDMVSIGPTIENPHSPHERVHVPSVARFHAALAELLDRLSA